MDQDAKSSNWTVLKKGSGEYCKQSFLRIKLVYSFCLASVSSHCSTALLSVAPKTNDANYTSWNENFKEALQTTQSEVMLKLKQLEIEYLPKAQTKTSTSAKKPKFLNEEKKKALEDAKKQKEKKEYETYCRVLTVAGKIEVLKKKGYSFSKCSSTAQQNNVMNYFTSSSK
jgi:primosomal protein N'